MRIASKQFLTFASVEADPHASSVGWLQARLAEMADVVRAGGSLSVYEPAAGALVQIDSPEGLSAWAERHFPVARFKP